jgi:hypothetical protein
MLQFLAPQHYNLPTFLLTFSINATPPSTTHPLRLSFTDSEDYPWRVKAEGNQLTVERIDYADYVLESYHDHFKHPIAYIARSDRFLCVVLEDASYHYRPLPEEDILRDEIDWMNVTVSETEALRLEVAKTLGKLEGKWVTMSGLTKLDKRLKRQVKDLIEIMDEEDEEPVSSGIRCNHLRGYQPVLLMNVNEAKKLAQYLMCQVKQCKEKGRENGFVKVRMLPSAY